MMPGSSTAGATVPEELERQSKRIKEQLTQLQAILDTITGDLGEMIRIMRNYSPELVMQINTLKSYLESYKGKANKIYSDMSLTLSAYAINLLQNLEDLTSSVTAIGNAIKSL